MFAKWKAGQRRNARWRCAPWLQQAAFPPGGRVRGGPGCAAVLGGRSGPGRGCGSTRWDTGERLSCASLPRRAGPRSCRLAVKGCRGGWWRCIVRAGCGLCGHGGRPAACWGWPLAAQPCERDKKHLVFHFHSLWFRFYHALLCFVYSVCILAFLLIKKNKTAIHKHNWVCHIV